MLELTPEQRDRFNSDIADAIRAEIEAAEERAQEARILVVLTINDKETNHDASSAAALAVEYLRETLGWYVAQGIDPIGSMRNDVARVSGKFDGFSVARKAAFQRAFDGLTERLKPRSVPEPQRFA